MLNLNHQHLLVQWLRSVFHLHGDESCQLRQIAGDASARQYFRVTVATQTWIVMMTKADRSFHQFIRVQELLCHLKLLVPKIKAIQYQQGWMVLEDFGDQTLETIIAPENILYRQKIYHKAINYLSILQDPAIQILPGNELPELEAHVLLEQIELFWTWFCQRHVQSEWDATYRIELQPVFEHLVREIAKYPKVMVHMDYHCRNLMIVPGLEDQVGVLDFQDATRGPILYDLVSLLEDAYWVCPPAEKKQYFEYYRAQMGAQVQCSNWTDSDWARCFSLIAMQRHLKNLGVFTRLHYRDHKSNYLQYLPRLIRYIIQHAESQPDFQSVSIFFKTHWVPLLEKQMGIEVACEP
jgi:aminoglycoside/choline kinase family phosphotransferase